MASGVEELYYNLNKLLDDICKFLTDETNYGKLSPLSRKQADELISRSKIQLQEISKIASDSNGYDGAYVDMEKKSTGSNEDDKNNIYASVDENVISNSKFVPPVQTNPYANLPAKELLQDMKCGSLSWKCKFILKFEKMRRIYAGIHNDWLLIYSSEKDCKPLQTFDLKFHKAQNVVPKQGKNFSQDFELICTLGEKKTYYFIAQTHKDMLQWISHINKCNDTLNQFPNLSLLDEEISETYDTIEDRRQSRESTSDKEDEEEEEEFYHDIEQFVPRHEIKKESNKPPDLPARKPVKPPVSLPFLPTIESQEELSSETYDPVDPHSSESSSSFSEDDEENIYEPFVAKVPEKNVSNVVPKNKLVGYRNSERITDEAEKPKILTKPVLKEKPKHLFILRK